MVASVLNPCSTDLIKLILLLLYKSSQKVYTEFSLIVYILQRVKINI